MTILSGEEYGGNLLIWHSITQGEFQQKKSFPVPNPKTQLTQINIYFPKLKSGIGYGGGRAHASCRVHLCNAIIDQTNRFNEAN